MLEIQGTGGIVQMNVIAFKDMGKTDFKRKYRGKLLNLDGAYEQIQKELKKLVGSKKKKESSKEA